MTHHFIASCRFLLATVLTACLLIGCGGQPADDGQSSADGSTGNKTKIVCTTGQVADMVANIAGEHANVTALMGPGVDPHLFQATTADLKALQRADMIVYNGLHLEGRIGDVLHKIKGKTVFAVVDQLIADHDPRLRVVAGFSGSHDPHLWHDAALWADCIPIVVAQMSNVAPDHAAAFQANGDAYREKLLEVDKFAREAVASIPESQRLLVTAHDAFEYFGKAYGIAVMGLKGVSTEDEVDLQQMQTIIDTLIEKKVPAVFVESSVSRTVVSALIDPCKAKGHDVKIGGELYSDALGPADSGADTYIGMIQANVNTIVKALGESP